jgi:hypothetical protein
VRPQWHGPPLWAWGGSGGKTEWFPRALHLSRAFQQAVKRTLGSVRLRVLPPRRRMPRLRLGGIGVDV